MARRGLVIRYAIHPPNPAYESHDRTAHCGLTGQQRHLGRRRYPRSAKVSIHYSIQDLIMKGRHSQIRLPAGLRSRGSHFYNQHSIAAPSEYNCSVAAAGRLAGPAQRPAAVAAVARGAAVAAAPERDLIGRRSCRR
jgi:hypothetical protein